MKRQVTIAVVGAALVAGSAGGFFAGQAFSGEEQPSLDRESICGGVDYVQQAAAFERVLPEGDHLAMVTNNNTDLDSGRWTSNCLIRLDGSNALYIDSRVVHTSADAWQRNLWADEIADGTDLRSIDLGTRTLSASNAAAIYVRCAARDPRKRTQMLSIAVTAQGKARSGSGSHRQDIIDIALRAAHLADTAAVCNPVDPLPDRAPRVG